MSRLAGKTVLMQVNHLFPYNGSTGASSGIGASCAQEFAKVGSNLVLAARRLERLEELKREFHSHYPSIKVACLKMDVRERSQVNTAIASIPEELSKIDVLVNNAGMAGRWNGNETVNDEAIDTMFATNVKGLLYVTQAVLPGMKARNAGNIINISSISGTQVYPGGGVYCATKHAVDALSRTLRMELVDTRINVTNIDPGLVETEFSIVRFRGDKQKADKVYEHLQPLTGQDVAETVVFAASRPSHVQIASMVLFPTAQAAVNVVSRRDV